MEVLSISNVRGELYPISGFFYDPLRSNIFTDGLLEEGHGDKTFDKQNSYRKILKDFECLVSSVPSITFLKKVPFVDRKQFYNGFRLLCPGGKINQHFKTFVKDFHEPLLQLWTFELLPFYRTITFHFAIIRHGIRFDKNLKYSIYRS